MSALAVAPPGNSQVGWKESFPKVEASPITALLDLGVLQAHVQGAYVYRFDRPSPDATLVAFAGLPPRNPSLSLAPAVSPLHWDRKTPVVLRSQAALDWRFASFPEFRDRHFDGIVSVPLLDSDETVGVANFCRIGEQSISPSALSLLMSLSLPLGALLVAAALRGQLQKATRELADRKVLERAKGLLQAHFQWTEEDAYLLLRRVSRRSRTPMRDIAQFVIESGAESLTQKFKPVERGINQ